MKVIFTSILLTLYSCSALKTDTNAKSVNVNIDLISTDMGTFNYRIRPKLIRKDKIKNLSIMTPTFYREKVSEYNDPAEEEYVKFLALKATILEVRGKGMNFVTCTRNIELGFVLCDSAKTAFIDFVSKDLSVDTSKKIQELL